MMRPISLLCMLLAIGSGLYLYRVKYRAQLLDREITMTLRGADDARARAALVRADYALLNDPIRLQELIDQYLTLKTTQPTQFTTLADLERRLPPIGIIVPEPAPEPDIPAAVIRPEPRPPVAEPRIMEPRIAIAPRPTPVTAPPPLTPAPTAAANPRPPTPLAPIANGPIAAAPRAAAPQAAAPPPTPVRAPVVAAPVVTATTIAADSGPPVVRSALGMARRAATQPAMPGGGGGNN